MRNFSQALNVELLKARRSRMPLLTLLAFSLAPLAGGFFMIVMKDPELARRLGLISAKAQMFAGEADWPTYLGLLAQATSIGGILLFSFIGSWVFGREYADHTIKDLLALPTSRITIVSAKFAVYSLWAAALTVGVYLVGLLVGAAVGLPPASADIFLQGTGTIASAAAMTIALVTPIAFFASAGRGYMAPMGAAVLALILAQVVAATGWGEYFPWSVPALYSGMAGPNYAVIGAVSYVIVGATSLAGIAGTCLWWQMADETG